LIRALPSQKTEVTAFNSQEKYKNPQILCKPQPGKVILYGKALFLCTQTPKYMKIICVGRNYAEHAKELQNPVPEEPVIFLKPDSSLLTGNADFYYPEFSKEVHFECELVYRVQREGKFIHPSFARSYLGGVGLGIDFTARDLQQKCKAGGLPWALAKGFHHSAPVSGFVPLDTAGDLAKLHFECRVNGETRQKGHSADMIFPVESLISYITRFMTIKTGDLIFTGTPSGVGPVQPGDRIEGFLEGEKMLDFYVK
jgi:2-keto-4-pentenoate hydratase/2-oxohepta-3-ene-1,7-dioic acid hydratase in catechol pathway